MLGDRFIAMDKERYWMLSVLVGAVMNIGINAALIPMFGAIGATIATAACEIGIFLIMCVLTFYKKRLSFKRVFASVWRYAISAAEMFCIMFIMQSVLPYTIWSFFVIGVAGSMAYVIMLFLLNDTFLKGLMKSVFNRLRRGKKNDVGKNS